MKPPVPRAKSVSTSSTHIHYSVLLLKELIHLSVSSEFSPDRWHCEQRLESCSVLTHAWWYKPTCTVSSDVLSDRLVLPPEVKRATFSGQLPPTLNSKPVPPIILPKEPKPRWVCEAFTSLHVQKQPKINREK